MLFGHQTSDNTNQIPDNVINEATTTMPPSNPLAADPATGISLPATPQDNNSDQPDDFLQPDLIVPTSPDIADALSDEITPQELSTPEPVLEEINQPTQNNDLLALKQQALGELSPLVDHLDQSPEEKFRTTMMMIQSTDNQALLKEAFAAAQAIPDDKVRAQALLDVINEINYFTQQK
jgi:hypothetical protein